MTAYGFQLLFNKWVIDKDPTSVLNYGIDWTKWLPAGDSVASVAWDLDGTINEVDNAIQGNVTYIRISGGALGESPMPSARATITTALSNEIRPQTLYFNMVSQ